MGYSTCGFVVRVELLVVRVEQNDRAVIGWVGLVAGLLQHCDGAVMEAQRQHAEAPHSRESRASTGASTTHSNGTPPAGGEPLSVGRRTLYRPLYVVRCTL